MFAIGVGSDTYLSVNKNGDKTDFDIIFLVCFFGKSLSLVRRKKHEC